MTRPRPIDLNRWAKMMSFFDYPFVTPVDFDVFLGIETQKLLLDYPWLKHMDAAHLAAAIHWECECLYTFDDELVRRFNGEKGLTVCTPATTVGRDLSD